MISFIIFAAALCALWLSSEKFIDQAIALSRKTGMSEFAIGTFVVGFGTSLPELFVSCSAGAQGLVGMALGNAYGSNIFNIAFILGISCLMCPLMASRPVILKSIGTLTAISGLSFICCHDQAFSRLECLTVLGCFVLGLKQFMGEDNETDSVQDYPSGVRRQLGIISILAKCFLWLGLLIVSSKFLVSSGTAIAKMLGVSDLVIGLTIVAAGTSLPELASSISAAKKKKTDLILGNIIGSNFFNAGVVVGLSGLICPYSGIPGEILFRDIPLMTLCGLSCLMLGTTVNGKPYICLRWKAGVIWILGFFTYLLLTV